MMQLFADANRIKARSLLGLLVIGFGVLSFVFPADAQSNYEMRNRIERLEKEIETLNRAMFRGEKPPAGTYTGGSAQQAADTEIRLSQMETELRNIRGQLEEQSYEMRQMREELERVKGDLEMRVQDLERNGGSVNGNGGAKYINRLPTTNNNAGSQNSGAIEGGRGYQWNSNAGAGEPNQLGSYTESSDSGEITGGADLAAATYENAFALLKQEKYQTAEREFQTFLDNHPDHPLAGNAKYWLGETYYVRADFAKAARTFAEGYQKYPKNSKAADNLLKLGMSLAALDKKDDACVALSQLEKEGFNASAPVLRRAKQEKDSLGC